jgi:predicted CopG family antitoxin
MAGKTISIDTEAHNRLKDARKADESFSQTIKGVASGKANLERLRTSFDEDLIKLGIASAVAREVSNQCRQSRRK